MMHLLKLSLPVSNSIKQVLEQAKEPKMETIKISNHALNLIPQDQVIIFCRMWEDSNIPTHEQAKIDCQKIGTGVMLLTGDYITPECVDREWRLNEDNTHAHQCDVYDPDYAVAWVSTATWEEYRKQVMKADQEWRKWASSCKARNPLFIEQAN